MHYVVIFCLVALFGIVNCYDWGPSTTACHDMLPLSMDLSKPMVIEDDMYFRIAPNVMKFHPGQKVYIRIKGKTSEDRYTYKGAFIMIKQDEPVGMWEPFHEMKYRILPCGNKENAAVVEANNMPKVVGDDVFIWQAPEACDLDNKFYILTGTVIKSEREYLPGLMMTMECVEAPPMVAEMKMPDDACEANYSMIPEMSMTSFENNYGGWWNSPKAALRWSRHMGPTASPATGPMGAADKRWYIYTEASSPARAGDMAVLMSSFGLAGCFCFRLEYHARVGKGTMLEIAVNDEVMYTMKKPMEKWMEAHVSVNHPGKVMIELRMTRGIDFRGDIGVDNVSFTPGACAEYRTEEGMMEGMRTKM